MATAHNVLSVTSLAYALFEGNEMKHFDYAREDTGNLVLLEHINLKIPDPSALCAAASEPEYGAKQPELSCG